MLKLSVMTVLLGMILGACGSSHHRTVATAPVPVPVPAAHQLDHYVVSNVDRHPPLPEAVVIGCPQPSIRPAGCATPGGVRLEGLTWRHWGDSVAGASGTDAGGDPVLVDAFRRRAGCAGGMHYTSVTVFHGARSHTEHLPGC